MGCNYSKTKHIPTNKKNIKMRYFDFHKNIRFDDIKPYEIQNYNQKTLTYYHKNNGFRSFIDASIFNLNTAFQGCFEDSRIKENIVVQFIYFFYSDNYLMKVKEGKNKFIETYFDINKNNMQYLWYSVSAFPRALFYLLLQTFVSVFLPNNEEDLDDFYGGRAIENYHGANSSAFVIDKIKKLYPKKDVLQFEKKLKEEIINEDLELYFQKMIGLEKMNNLFLEKREIDKIKTLEIEKETLESVKRKILINFDHEVLFNRFFEI